MTSKGMEISIGLLLALCGGVLVSIAALDGVDQSEIRNGIIGLVTVVVLFGWLWRWQGLSLIDQKQRLYLETTENLQSLLPNLLSAPQLAGPDSIPSILLFQAEPAYSSLNCSDDQNGHTKLYLVDKYSGDENSVYDQTVMGYWVVSRIPQNIYHGHHYLSLDGDTIFNYLKQNNAQLTEFEWNDFNHVFHVETDDPVEARYILPPDRMLSIHDQITTSRFPALRVAYIPNEIIIMSGNSTVQEPRRDSLGVDFAKQQEVDTLAYIIKAQVALLRLLHRYHSQDGKLKRNA